MSRNEMAVLIEKVQRIEKWVEKVENNHFPSLEKRLDTIERKMAYYSGGIVAVVSLIELFIKIWH